MHSDGLDFSSLRMLLKIEFLTIPPRGDFQILGIQLENFHPATDHELCAEAEQELIQEMIQQIREIVPSGLHLHGTQHGHRVQVSQVGKETNTALLEGFLQRLAPGVQDHIRRVVQVLIEANFFGTWHGNFFGQLQRLAGGSRQ